MIYRLVTAALIIGALVAPSRALALDSGAYNPDNSKIQALCSSVYMMDYSPDMQHTTFHIYNFYYTPSYATNVVAEVSIRYRDGRALTWLLPFNSTINSDIALTVDRFADNEPITLRCSIATGVLTNDRYVAPWLPLSFADDYKRNPATPVYPVPLVTPTP